MFLAKHSPLELVTMAIMNNLYLNFLFQKITYIMVLKVTKFREDRLNGFLYISKNPQGDHFEPPVQIGLRDDPHPRW